MDETKTWLRRPRYSPLDLALFVMLAVVTAVVGVYFVARAGAVPINDQIVKAITPSPLATVIVAARADEPNESAYRGQYTFTTDWFTPNIPVWQRVFWAVKGQPDLRYLEVGCYEGRSLLWMLENVLTAPTARATVIDPLDRPFRENYYRNIQQSGASEKVTTLPGYSQIVLRSLPLDCLYDVIYIDGSHACEDVLEDATLSWRLLKPGGLMVFDDYRYIERADKDTEGLISPKPGIDAFAQCFGARCEVVQNEYQLIIRKKI